MPFFLFGVMLAIDHKSFLVAINVCQNIQFVDLFVDLTLGVAGNIVRKIRKSTEIQRFQCFHWSE